MIEKKPIQHRMTRRAAAHDYRLPGIYHITLHVAEGLGQPLGAVMGSLAAPDGSADAPHTALSPVGQMVEHELLHAIPAFYPMIEIQDYVIMPEHLHFIIEVHDAITTRNGKNSSYPLSTASVRFSPNDSHWMQTVDGWSYIAFQTENSNGNAELITMIPGDSIPSEGNYSQLRNLFNTTEQNEYRESIVPSQSLYLLSAAQKYCHYSSGGEYVIAPAGLPENRSGDLRLQAVFTQVDNANIMLNGKRVTNYVTNAKYTTRNVHIYRRAMVYLRMAEALNRAGFPRFAFQILKRGVNNSVMESEVIPYYPADEAWLRTFNFPDNMYFLETTAGQTTENTMGLHSRGCGYSAANTTYEMPTDDALSGDALLQYQIEKVEDLIIDEEALEFAFEGHRFYDLMRVSMHRSDPAYLASRVARRNGTVDAALLQKLSSMDNWYLGKLKN